VQIQTAALLMTVIQTLSAYLILQRQSIIVGAMLVSQEMGNHVLQIQLAVMLSTTATLLQTASMIKVHQVIVADVKR
jgi:hypothetical protein